MPPGNGLFWALDVKGAKPMRDCSAYNPMIVMLERKQCDNRLVRLARAAIEALMQSPTTESDMSRTALDAYIAGKAEIDTMLARLAALSDDHFCIVPDEVTWGDVGTLAHYAELLKRITDSAFKEGPSSPFAAVPL